MPTLTFEDSQIKAIEKFEKQFAPEIESFEIGKSQTNLKVSGVADVAEDTDVPEIIDGTEVTDVTEITGVTEDIGVQEVTDVIEVTGVPETTDVTGMNDVPVGKSRSTFKKAKYKLKSKSEP